MANDVSSHKLYAEAEPGKGVRPEHPADTAHRLEIVDAGAGVVRPVGAGRKRIAVVGFAASSRNEAPFDDPDWEIWTLNQLYRHVPRSTRHFDIHANWREDNVEGTDHPRWLAECGVPVYMADLEPSVPTCVRYPLQRVINRVVGADYFTSTVAFMLAYAVLVLDEQVDAEVDELGRRDPHAFDGDPGKLRAWLRDRYQERSIGIWGIDLIVGKEWDWQKACVEYILGLAHARGIEVRLPAACALLRQQWRYGYETAAVGHPIKFSELIRRRDALQNERANLIARLHTIDGALQEVGYWHDVADLRMKGGVVRLNEDT